MDPNEMIDRIDQALDQLEGAPIVTDVQMRAKYREWLEARMQELMILQNEARSAGFDEIGDGAGELLDKMNDERMEANEWEDDNAS